MKHRVVCAVVTAFCVVTTAYADPPKGFEEFRKGLLDNFDSFKSRILEHYSDFLAGEWHEYESLEAASKYSGPKPEAIPQAIEMMAEEADGQQKEMLATMGFFNQNGSREGVMKVPESLNWIRNSANLYTAKAPADTTVSPVRTADTLPASVGDSSLKPGDIVSPEGIVSGYDGEVFDFYGMKFAMPRTDFSIRDSITETIQYAYQWDELVKDDVASRVNPALLEVQKTSGISDYLLFEMIMAWLDHKFPHKNDASKMSAAHYFLANMGFGVRVAIDDNSNPYILLPFTEKVFNRSCLKMEKAYYVFSTPGRQQVKRMSLRSPYLPESAELGKDLNLRMSGLNIPVKPYHYSFEYGDLRLDGELNENVIPMLYRYPQMDTGGFAATMISPEVRADVVRQVKEQLGGMEPMQAADKLLAMIQFAFPYATDDNFHGFEKPYFFEESLYYPKSDCEDRAVFYSYLLWNALGLETDLIAYPVHEATAIKADKVWGGDAHYEENGEKYYISDPTFQGAPTGQCMRRFLDVKPVIDLRYSR